MAEDDDSLFRKAKHLVREAFHLDRLHPSEGLPDLVDLEGMREKRGSISARERAARAKRDKDDGYEL